MDRETAEQRKRRLENTKLELEIRIARKEDKYFVRKAIAYMFAAVLGTTASVVTATVLILRAMGVITF